MTLAEKLAAERQQKIDDLLRQMQRLKAEQDRLQEQLTALGYGVRPMMLTDPRTVTIFDILEEVWPIPENQDALSEWVFVSRDPRRNRPIKPLRGALYYQKDGKEVAATTWSELIQYPLVFDDPETQKIVWVNVSNKPGVKSRRRSYPTNEIYAIAKENYDPTRTTSRARTGTGDLSARRGRPRKTAPRD